MIYTLTLNPAVDITGFVDDLVLDEKNYVDHEVHTPGGNGINAGIIAHRLRAPVLLSGFLGGSRGQELKTLLSDAKVPHRFLKIAGQTRMNITISARDDHHQTRLSFPGPRIALAESRQLAVFLGRVKAGDLVLFGGSLPPGIQTAFIRKLISQLKKRNVRCLVDMPGPLLKDLIKSKPDFIKPNLTEFQSLVGRKVSSLKEILPLAKKLLRFVPVICISSVEDGALLLNEAETWHGKIPKVKIRSTVGAGDSMVGAMASVWAKNADAPLEQLLRLGLAASCATLIEPGLTLGSRKSILLNEPHILMRKI